MHPTHTRPSPPARLLRLTLFAALLGLAACQPEAAPQPDILLILADDMGYSDIGAFGGEVRTPNLDRLAAEGVRLTQFYNAARCCPTRAALLTGLHPHQAGMGAMVSSVSSTPVIGPYQGFLNEQSVTLAEVLQQAGYRTYMSGKWHVGEKPAHWPRRRGFDRYFGLISGASSYFEIIRDQPIVRQMALDDAPWEPPAEGFYMTDAFTEYALSFLEEHEQAHDDRPFFLYLAYTAPHWPLHALPEDIDRYRNRYHIGWDSLRAERHARMKAMGLIEDRHALSPRPASIPAWADVEDKEDWALRMAVYAAMIDRLDQGIGRVIDALEAAGRLENTLILFLSDNGGSAESITGRGLHDSTAAIGARGSYVAYREPWANASNTPFRWYKQWTHEGGIATPFIAHWPAQLGTPGRIERRPGHVTDLMATALEAAGVAYPDSLAGRAPPPPAGQSLLPVLRGEAGDGSDPLYWEHMGNRAVRHGDWKLVWDRNRERWELYDLESDPTELVDLAADHPERVADLEARWHAWAQGVGVDLER